MIEIGLSEPHAITRARERYGIELAIRDLDALSRRCRKGEGLMETQADGTSCHLLICGARVLWIIYRSRKNGSRLKDGTIVTILPPSAGNARARHDYRFKMQRRGRR